MISLFYNLLQNNELRPFFFSFLFDRSYDFILTKINEQKLIINVWCKAQSVLCVIWNLNRGRARWSNGSGVCLRSEGQSYWGTSRFHFRAPRNCRGVWNFGGIWVSPCDLKDIARLPLTVLFVCQVGKEVGKWWGPACSILNNVINENYWMKFTICNN